MSKENMKNGRIIADMGNSSPYRAEVEHPRKKGIWKVTTFLFPAHGEIQTYPGESATMTCCMVDTLPKCCQNSILWCRGSCP